MARTAPTRNSPPGGSRRFLLIAAVLAGHRHPRDWRLPHPGLAG